MESSASYGVRAALRDSPPTEHGDLVLPRGADWSAYLKNSLCLIVKLKNKPKNTRNKIVNDIQF